MRDKGEPVEVARYGAIGTDMAADIAVSELRASGLMAYRFPAQFIVGPVMGFMREDVIRIFVPADQAEQAREILAGIEDDEGGNGGAGRGPGAEGE
jgi:hypothetical protein